MRIEIFLDDQNIKIIKKLVTSAPIASPRFAHSVNISLRLKIASSQFVDIF